MGSKKDRVGERFTSNEGCEFIIIEYNGCKDLWVEFCDEHRARVRTEYRVCKKGSIKNPCHPSVYGHGYLGLLSDSSRPKTRENVRATREYEVWVGMIRRCYDPKWHETRQTYKNCEVCERWLCYANFLEDLPLIEGYELWRDNPNQGISLDKDLKQQGVENKVYSLNTCCFVSQGENSKESNERCGTLNQPIKIYGVNTKTGEKTRVFDSISEVERELGLHHGSISECLKPNGRYKTTGGYKWYKVEENLN